jgi:hypothetical protein
MSEEEAHTFIRRFCDTEHPEDILEVVCNPQSADKVFDLQRTPVLKVAGQRLIPAAVIANSSIIHNALQATRFRFDGASSVDPITNTLKDACTAAGMSTSTRAEYTFQGTSGEIDLLALFENKLFAFECKNSLTPCSIHELRQSYGYIMKAFQQLSKFRCMMAIPGFIAWLRNKTGLTVSDQPHLTTCVVMGNRMFSGYREDGHCVRNIHELCNALLGGVMRFAFPISAEDPYGPKLHLEMRIWQGEHLTADDLAEYLGEHPLYKMAFEALIEHDDVIAFGDKQLIFRTFVQNALAFGEKIRQHHRTHVTRTDVPP